MSPVPALCCADNTTEYESTKKLSRKCARVVTNSLVTNNKSSGRQPQLPTTSDAFDAVDESVCGRQMPAAAASYIPNENACDHPTLSSYLFSSFLRRRAHKAAAAAHSNNTAVVVGRQRRCIYSSCSSGGCDITTTTAASCCSYDRTLDYKTGCSSPPAPSTTVTTSSSTTATVGVKQQVEGFVCGQAGGDCCCCGTDVGKLSGNALKRYVEYFKDDFNSLVVGEEMSNIFQNRLQMESMVNEHFDMLTISPCDVLQEFLNWPVTNRRRTTTTTDHLVTQKRATVGTRRNVLSQ
eukprot:GHVS01061688.1.p1 GENE.GHVS01061688.1~~GHVS01061688.1.p1  ORF type:complete len:340 (+),score=75.29 GHVS01061688.1:141-1022(+)